MELNQLEFGIVNQTERGFRVLYNQKFGIFSSYRKLMVPDKSSSPVKAGMKVRIRSIIKDTLPEDKNHGVIFVVVEPHENKAEVIDSVQDLEKKYWLDPTNGRRLISPDGWFIGVIKGQISAYHVKHVTYKYEDFNLAVDVRPATDDEILMFKNKETNRRIVYNAYCEAKNAK